LLLISLAEVASATTSVSVATVVIVEVARATASFSLAEVVSATTLVSVVMTVIYFLLLFLVEVASTTALVSELTG
jgi:hypothetical protein